MFYLADKITILVTTILAPMINRSIYSRRSALSHCRALPTARLMSIAVMLEVCGTLQITYSQMIVFVSGAGGQAAAAKSAAIAQAAALMTTMGDWTVKAPAPAAWNFSSRALRKASVAAVSEGSQLQHNTHC